MDFCLNGLLILFLASNGSAVMCKPVTNLAPIQGPVKKIIIVIILNLIYLIYLSVKREFFFPLLPVWGSDSGFL